MSTNLVRISFEMSSMLVKDEQGLPQNVNRHPNEELDCLVHDSAEGSCIRRGVLAISPIAKEPAGGIMLF